MFGFKSEYIKVKKDEISSLLRRIYELEDALAHCKVVVNDRTKAAFIKLEISKIVDNMLNDKE